MFSLYRMIRMLRLPIVFLLKSLVAFMKMDEGHREVKDTDDGRDEAVSPPKLSQPRTVSVKKQPPPESIKSVRVRGLVIGSFWAIVIFLGLPTWWWTTSIYRARLPLQEMLEWADGKVCATESNCLLLTTTKNHRAGMQTLLSPTNCH